MSNHLLLKASCAWTDDVQADGAELVKVYHAGDLEIDFINSLQDGNPIVFRPFRFLMCGMVYNGLEIRMVGNQTPYLVKNASV